MLIDAVSSIDRGKEFQLAGDWNSALSCYRRAYIDEPDCAELNSLIGQVLTRKGDVKSAYAFFLFASELEPREFTHFYNLGCNFQAVGEYNKAISLFEKSLMLNSQSSHAYAELGHCLMHLKNEKLAIRYLKKALKINVTHASTWADLGYCYMETGKVLDATRCLTKSDQLRSSFNSKFNLCKLALLKCDKAFFCKNLIEALRYAGTNTSMLNSLHNLIEGQNRIEVSEIYLNKLHDQLEITL